jgi:hypothetical protein
LRNFKFWRINILSWETPEEEEVNEMRPGGRTSTGGGADAHKYRGSLKSSMGSITQIYSSTQGGHKNINKTLAIEASLWITHVYQ